MLRLFAIVTATLALCFFPAVAQVGANADSLPGVDFSGLSEAQRTTALKLINARECSCTCGMRVGECRMKDPNCSYSRGLAGVIVAALKSGKSEKEALTLADASEWAHLPERDTRLLGDPVKLATDGSPTIGPANAPVKLVEFSDFQCPYCVMATPQIAQLLKIYPTEVSLTFKQFPLDIHSQAALAARASVAAEKQGKFWPMHDALFNQKGKLSPEVINRLAGTLGLSLIRFEADLASPEVQQRVQRDLDEGSKAGVAGTPALYINGKHLNAMITMDVLKPGSKPS